MSGDPLRVVALTTHTPEHLTWRLRVEVLLPYLQQAGIAVTTQRLPKDRRATRATLDSLGRYDIVWLHRHLLWPSELRRLRRVAPLAVLDIDDPVGLSSSSLGNFSLSRCLRFRATARGAAAVFAASDGLRRLASAHNARVHLIPLCAEPAGYTMRVQARPQGEPLRVLWLGSKSTFKYLQRHRDHLEAIGRACPHAELTVVGHSCLELTHLPVRNLAWSPATEREQLAACHVGLAPMPRDRWTEAKAALKPLQYLASGMPFLGSAVGVNLELADEGRNGLLADTPAEWAAAVARLEADEALRQQMGRQGVAFIGRRHTPDVLARQVAQEFHSLARGPWANQVDRVG